MLPIAKGIRGIPPRLLAGDVVARDLDLVCVTNDRALRRACFELRVGVPWGLELIIDLVQLGRLSAAGAERVAVEIQAANRTLITDAILQAFVARLPQAR